MKSREHAIGFTPGAPFSNGYVCESTLYIAGQQGPDSDGKVTGVDITKQIACDRRRKACRRRSRL
jgi:2-iminobutanoate/2-iminopropanoate deaminase